MLRILAASIMLLQASAAAAQTQGTIVQEPLPDLPTAPSSPQSDQPVPLVPGTPPSSQMPASQQPVPHLQRDPIAAGPAPGTAVPPPSGAAPMPPVAHGPATDRVFCDQNVTFRVAPPASVPERYRSFIGIFSDASWTPQLCAALVVQNVQPDGTASILYAFGPMGTNIRGPGGVLNGTGVIRDGELRFQNSDGSQFAFKPLYSDLDGQLTTPKGQNYEAVFKRSF